MNSRPNQSAGLLMFRKPQNALEVFLVHPGGPYWARKDAGVWTLPKGEFGADEDALTAAQREFHEETGFWARGPFLCLGSVRQKSGKTVFAWGFAGDCDATQLVSNTCQIEWPPRSKRSLTIPEVDRGAWFTLAGAEAVLRAEQLAFLTRLEQQVVANPRQA